MDEITIELDCLCGKNHKMNIGPGGIHRFLCGAVLQRPADWHEHSPAQAGVMFRDDPYASMTDEEFEEVIEKLLKLEAIVGVVLLTSEIAPDPSFDRLAGHISMRRPDLVDQIALMLRRIANSLEKGELKWPQKRP